MHDKPRTHEVVLSEHPPTVDQMYLLADFAVKSSLVTGSRVHDFWRQGVHRWGYRQSHLYKADLSEVLFESEAYQKMHDVGILIARRAINSTPVCDWDMTLIDTHQYRRCDGSWYGVRDTYRFSWNVDTMTKAYHTSGDIPRSPAGEDDMYNDLHTYSIPDDVASMLALEQNRSEISYDDCAMLITDMAEYYEARNEEARMRPQST